MAWALGALAYDQGRPLDRMNPSLPKDRGVVQRADISHDEIPIVSIMHTQLIAGRKGLPAVFFGPQLFP